MTTPSPSAAGAALAHADEHALASRLARMRAAPENFYSQQLRQEYPEQLPSDCSQWQHFPLTRRAELVRDQLAHLPLGTRRFADAGPPVRAGVSGSGEDLLVLAWSAAELACERAAGIRILTAAGITPGLGVANTLPGALATPGSLLLGDVVADMGALDVPLGSIDGDVAARHAWELVDRVQPGALVLEPDSASRLLAAAPAAARPWWHTLVWLRRAAAVSAPSAIPAAAGFTGTQRVWLAIPEARCFAADVCGRGRYHFDSSLLTEVVHEDSGAPCEPGYTGCIVVTLLDGETGLLRYVTGWCGRTYGDVCPCGRPGTAVEVV